VDEKEAHPTFSLQQKPLKTEYRGENATGVPISRKNDFLRDYAFDKLLREDGIVCRGRDAALRRPVRVKRAEPKECNVGEDLLKPLRRCQQQW